MTTPLKVVAVILAAGSSSRLGRPKQLIAWGSETLLERMVRTAVEAGCTPLVVLGCAAERITAECNLSRCKVVVNPTWSQGMGGSIRIGIESAIAFGAESALVMTCDQPAVNSHHLRQLIDASKSGQPVASAYAGRKGVPACFPASSFADLLALEGDSGARRLLEDATSIELPFGDLDVDTEESLRLAQRILLHTNA